MRKILYFLAFLPCFYSEGTEHLCQTSFQPPFTIEIQNETFSLEELIRQYKGMDGLARLAETYFDHNIRKAFDVAKNSLKEHEPKKYKRILPDDLDWQRFDGSLDQFRTLRRLYKETAPNEFLSIAVTETGMSRRDIEKNMGAVLRAEQISARGDKSKTLDALGLQGRGSFSEETQRQVWLKAIPIGGFDQDKTRQDKYGNRIDFDQYGKDIGRGPFSWEIDHILPVSKGGGDEIENLQPLSRLANRSKGARAEAR